MNYYYFKKNFTIASRNIDTTNISQFLAIFAQNVTILPQNKTFYDLFSLAIYTIVCIILWSNRLQNCTPFRLQM